MVHSALVVPLVQLDPLDHHLLSQLTPKVQENQVTLLVQEDPYLQEILTNQVFQKVQ